jgi:cytochrome b subunit of formate dehydrogenase
MDVFRFNEDVNKSVIAYPENCQTCGQCYVYCLGHSLAMSGEAHAYPMTSVRAASRLPMNRQLLIADNPKSRIVMPAVVAVLGGMFAHNAIVWNRKAQDKRAAAAASGETVTRMSLSQRWQHFVMVLSFIVLVATGFSMRYLGVWLENSLGFGRHALKFVHLGAGVMLLAGGLFHLVYILSTREGRKLICDVFPRGKDFADVIRAMGYYLHLRKEKPRYGRFAYAEKVEYWSLFLGTITMGVTGILMWFYVPFGRLLSDWGVSFARSWHFWEAVVASLAIVIWHFYHVIFDPDVAPMNWAWRDGKMPADLYRHEHELDTDAVQGCRN